jgi:hypothetical protein
MHSLNAKKFITQNEKESLASIILTYAEQLNLDKKSLEAVFSICLDFFDYNSKIDLENRSGYSEKIPMDLLTAPLRTKI